MIIIITLIIIIIIIIIIAFINFNLEKINSTKYNRRFPSCLSPLFQSES